MRIPIVFILAAIACAMLFAAGCTSSSTAQPASPAAAEPTPAAGTTPALPAATTAEKITTWNGTWSTTYLSFDTEYPEVITLTHLGNSVTGTYHNGLGSIKATDKDGKITGTWDDSDGAGTYSGFLVFEKSADGRSFTGKWVSSGEGEDALASTTQYWNGALA